MTEEKKDTAKKPRQTAAQKKAAETKAAKAAETKVEEEVVEEVEEKRVIDKDTEVVVFNNTSGRLVYSAKKGNGYLEFSEFMDSDVMTVEELQQMRNGHRRLIESGALFIDDEDVLKHLRLDKLIGTVEHPDTLRELVENNESNKIVEILEKLSVSSKESLYNLIKAAYTKDKFVNATTIRKVEEAVRVHKDDSILLRED